MTIITTSDRIRKEKDDEIVVNCVLKISFVFHHYWKMSSRSTYMRLDTVHTQYAV